MTPQGRGVEFYTQLTAPFSCEYLCARNISSPAIPSMMRGLLWLNNENRRVK